MYSCIAVYLDHMLPQYTTVIVYFIRVFPVYSCIFMWCIHTLCSCIRVFTMYSSVFYCIQAVYSCILQFVYCVSMWYRVFVYCYPLHAVGDWYGWQYTRYMGFGGRYIPGIYRYIPYQVYTGLYIPASHNICSLVDRVRKLCTSAHYTECAQVQYSLQYSALAIAFAHIFIN